MEIKNSVGWGGGGEVKGMRREKRGKHPAGVGFELATPCFNYSVYISQNW